MALRDWKGRGAAHAPVHPVTGAPVAPASSAGSAVGGGLDEQSDDAASGSASASAVGKGARPQVGEAQQGDPAYGQGAPHVQPPTPFWDADEPARIATGASATGTPGTAPLAEGTMPEVDPSTVLADTPPTDPNEELVHRLDRLLDNRALAISMLFVLLFVVVGLDSLLLFVVLLFVGYLAIDRFPSARRCVVMGGAAWLTVIFIGFLVSESVDMPIVFGLDHLFMFCGFLLAVAVCGAFFAGRSMYRFGFERGQEEADHTIAEHLEERLIERPDDWRELDGTFLEVESALARVRERERRAEQALRDEAGRKDDLVTYLAHDLKTPLASVVGYLSLLEEAPDLPAEQRARFTGVALEKAHRLDELIEEFFDITRFDFHDIVLTRGYVDLNLMLAQVADEFYPTLAAQHKTAEIDVPEGLVVLIDGDKMARVFNNVMKNAIAYSYEGTTIRVTARRLGPAGAERAAAPATGVEGATAATPVAAPVEIRFEDQGDPIPSPKLKVIFEKFYRLDAARATNRGGAGLGLAIAKEIVSAHGGTIACESTPERTVFIITLPA